MVYILEDMGTKSSDTKFSLQLHLNIVRHLCFFLKAVKIVCMLCDHLFLLPIFNCNLLCVLYIAIDFDVFQTFLDLKLLIQGTFERLSEYKYEIFHESFNPESHILSIYDFYFSKGGVALGPEYIFHKLAFKLSDGMNKILLRKTFVNNINNCNCNNN